MSIDSIYLQNQLEIEENLVQNDNIKHIISYDSIILYREIRLKDIFPFSGLMSGLGLGSVPLKMNKMEGKDKY